ncbi:hypothetical protein K438DRAFT_7693 [Mycena galopus ATCC 62051]|nr:hypothetical protein K438DRAFT_7693 [Mycena galopus ATCC 62051]
MLRDLTQTWHIPFLEDAAETISVLLGEINIMKTNKGLLGIVGLIHQLVGAIVHVCLVEQGILPIKLLDSIGLFVKTLRKIQSSVQLHQELGKIKRLIRQHEIGVELRTYEEELETILSTFKILNGATLATDLIELELNAQQRHEELMTLLAAQEDGKASEYSFSVGAICFESPSDFK